MYIPYHVRRSIRFALEEDIGNGDITTTLIVPEDQKSRAAIVAKAGFIVAGIPFAMEAFNAVDGKTDWKIFSREGSVVKRGDVIAEISGSTRALLTSERVGLNVLQRLSGIATLTGAFVKRVRGTHVKIMDTRKTSPGLRFMEKYAVRMGGGHNHRFGLYDGILIKDNHIEAAGSVRKAVSAAREAHRLMKIEVEVENLEDLREAIRAGADVIMLDNMSLEDMSQAVKVAKGKVLLEASGNMSIGRVRAVAETGVDLISVGLLTHSAPAADISMKIVG
ncbi:MAG TPA: carboxylating nicotinate-nucleotide diphosphorylase [Thermodesulfovibrionales bacterium]|jgi:nicotinate-nucleotide pyrophosphorylase (carboxylating)|nr:carboxylating nicotinate-nucleotide diphosphorylase [Thermodesulfovibrionales bacterium]